MAKSLAEVYADNNQAYKDARILPRWMPPDGDYTAALTDVIDMVVGDNDDLLIVVVAQIVDGPYQGRSFVAVRSGPKMRGPVKELADMVLQNTALDLKATVDALKARVMDPANAVTVAVGVKTTTNAAGKTYTNARINGLVG